MPAWSRHYRMDSYVTRELHAIATGGELPGDAGRAGICGHSMGGHGALVLALRNPGKYRSVSAFAPIAAPSRCPCKKAFGAYLGDDVQAWAAYDASALMARLRQPSPAASWSIRARPISSWPNSCIPRFSKPPALRQVSR